MQHINPSVTTVGSLTCSLLALCPRRRLGALLLRLCGGCQDWFGRDANACQRGFIRPDVSTSRSIDRSIRSAQPRHDARRHTQPDPEPPATLPLTSAPWPNAGTTAWKESPSRGGRHGCFFFSPGAGGPPSDGGCAPDPAAAAGAAPPAPRDAVGGSASVADDVATALAASALVAAAVSGPSSLDMPVRPPSGTAVWVLPLALAVGLCYALLWKGGGGREIDGGVSDDGGSEAVLVRVSVLGWGASFLAARPPQPPVSRRRRFLLPERERENDEQEQASLHASWRQYYDDVSRLIVSSATPATDVGQSILKPSNQRVSPYALFGRPVRRAARQPAQTKSEGPQGSDRGGSGPRSTIKQSKRGG